MQGKNEELPLFQHCADLTHFNVVDMKPFGFIFPPTMDSTGLQLHMKRRHLKLMASLQIRLTLLACCVNNKEIYSIRVVSVILFPSLLNSCL